MSWKRQSTSVTVDAECGLDEFGTGQLLQELINRAIITEAAAAVLLRREGVEQLPKGIDGNELCEAREELLRGRRREALIHLERALGREWLGALQ
jgi:hypothetical protein